MNEKGHTLLEFISLHVSSSKREIKRQIEHNACTLNGQIERVASTRLVSGDTVDWHPQELTKPSFDPDRILFEDDALMIYNKPPGIACDANGILALLKSYGRFFLVHRLDKETSGVLILAKNAASEKVLLEAFKERKVEKKYIALVYGLPKQNGVIENSLGKVGAFQGQTRYGSVAEGKGKRAKTSFSVEKFLKRGALVACYPETGRTHQIRIHLSEMGHPILGDYQYGKHLAPRLMLHAYKVSFQHRGKKLTITAPIPKDFQTEMLKMSKSPS